MGLTLTKVFQWLFTKEKESIVPRLNLHSNIFQATFPKKRKLHEMLRRERRNSHLASWSSHFPAGIFGVYRLKVVKDGEVLDQINLDKWRHIFGRQVATCEFVFDHPSVSWQHAAIVRQKNGSIDVTDLGLVHGTFVANELLTKDNPVELEGGQSLRFVASSRSYILRKKIWLPFCKHNSCQQSSPFLL